MLIDGKSFFGMPVKNGEKTDEQIIEMGRNYDYTTSNLLDYEYFLKRYKLMTIDLSKQIELENPYLTQQINFTGRLEKNEEETVFFIIETSEETAFEFSQNVATIVSFFDMTVYNNRISKDCKFIRQCWLCIFKICNKKMVCYQWSK